jgi:glyoxylase-like metal-dependent hydrolase (beta-lactamase superfamily II)
LIDGPTVLSLGDREVRLYPVSGGETSDALLICLPEPRVLFVGDVFMPYLGAPFLPGGSVEGLLEAIRCIRDLDPRLMIHGSFVRAANALLRQGDLALALRLANLGLHRYTGSSKLSDLRTQTLQACAEGTSS